MPAMLNHLGFQLLSRPLTKNLITKNPTTPEHKPWRCSVKRASPRLPEHNKSRIFSTFEPQRTKILAQKHMF